MGAEKWLDIEIWNSPAECFSALKKRGYRIATTYLGTDSVFFFTLQHFSDLVFFQSSTFLSIGFLVNLRSKIPHEFQLPHVIECTIICCFQWKAAVFFFVQTTKIACPFVYRDKMHLLKKTFAIKPYCRYVWCCLRTESTQSINLHHKWIFEVKWWHMYPLFTILLDLSFLTEGGILSNTDISYMVEWIIMFRIFLGLCVWHGLVSTNGYCCGQWA